MSYPLTWRLCIRGSRKGRRNSCARFPETGWIATISKPRFRSRSQWGHARRTQARNQAMTDQDLALFDSRIGLCAIAWGPRGINGTQLPMGGEQKIRTRISQRHAEATEAEPTAEVQQAIDRIVKLLAGEPDDLTDIP